MITQQTSFKLIMIKAYLRNSGLVLDLAQAYISKLNLVAN